MIADIFDLRRTSETGFFPIRQYSLKQMRVLGFLCRSVNQARIRRRVLWLELLDRFEIGRVGHDFCELLHLLQLIQSCFRLLLLNDSSAHDNSSLFWLTQNVSPNKKSTTTNSRRSRDSRQHVSLQIEGHRSVLPLSRRGHSRRRFSRPSRTNRSADKIVSKFPHWTGKFATFSERVVERVDEHVDFFFADDERRKDFQHVHRVTGDLRENAVLAQYLGYDHLREEHLVDLVQKLPSHLKLELVRFVKLNAHHQAFAAHFFYEGMLRLQPFDSLREQRAHFSCALDQIFLIDDFQRCQSTRHCEIVAAEGCGVHNAAIHAAKRLLINFAAGDNCAARHVTAAQRFREGDDVGLQIPMLESEHLTRSTEAGLDFIRDQQRSVFAAKFLGTNKEIRLWRLTAFALNGLDDKRRHIACAQLPI